MPAANITSISAQQQPTQKAPWRAPSSKPAAHAPPVVAGQELRGVAALVETGVLQRRELERAGERQHRPADRPLMAVQPRARIDRGVQAGVEPEGKQPERAPYDRVATEEGRHRPPARGRAGGCPREQPHERQARGQHHRRDHHLPGEQEHERRENGRRAVHEESVVVHERRRAGRLGRDRGGPGGGDAREHGHGERAEPAADRAWRMGAAGRAGGPRPAAGGPGESWAAVLTSGPP